MRLGAFEEDWEISVSTKEVCVRDLSFVQRILKWRTRYPLSKFHAYVRQNFEATEQGIVHPVILNADYMRPVEGVPTKLELVNGWSIPKRDLGKMLGDKHVLIYAREVVVLEATSRVMSSIELKPGLWGFRIDLKKLFWGK